MISKQIGKLFKGGGKKGRKKSEKSRGEKEKNIGMVGKKNGN